MSFGMDPFHSATMLSLGGIKCFVFARKPRPDANLVRGLLCKTKAFYSPETQHGRRVIKVYHARRVSKNFISRRNLQVWATEPKLLKMVFASTAEYTQTTDNKGNQSFATYFLKIVVGGGGVGGGVT